jgi:hypothetical protein
MHCNNCIYAKQYKECVKCSHKNKNMESNEKHLGRGRYIYFNVYNECDCNGYKKKSNWQK